jgi:uncharacterized protein (TIGR03435 family)
MVKGEVFPRNDTSPLTLAAKERYRIGGTVTHQFFCRVAVLLVAAAVVHGQAVSRPSFEVASVKPSQPLHFEDEADLFRQMYEAARVDPAQVRLTNQSLEALIERAYRLKSFQISAPKWISEERYDIIAKIPDGVSTDLVPEMLQSLLEDRLQLKCHRESKEFDVFVLSVREGGLKIPQKPTDYKFSATAAAWPRKMEPLANELTRAVGRPVIDKTGLRGEYMVPRDFTNSVIKASVVRNFPESVSPDIAAETPAVSDLRLSLQAMGLSLNPAKQSSPLLVIDHAEKTPAEN